jgi:hypothetical protein
LVLADPVDIARAHGAVDSAWMSLKSRNLLPSDVDSGRETLLDIVASNIFVAANDHELIRRSVERFLTDLRHAPRKTEVARSH